MITMNKKPDVYIERLPMESTPSGGAGWGITGFVGAAFSGEVGVPKYVTSFAEFVKIFARGKSIPYMDNSYLAYVVFDYFDNGGSAAYICRLADGATKAQATSGALTFSAIDEGAWANTVLKISSTSNTDVSGTFDIVIKLNGDIVEKFTELSNTVADQNYWITVLNGSGYVTPPATGTLVAFNETAFASGTDGTLPIVDAQLDTALPKFKGFDITWIATSGFTSTAAITKFKSFASENGVLCIADCPKNVTKVTAKASATAMGTDFGAVYTPWGRTISPATAKEVLVPPSGMVAGNFAKSAQGSGIAKAPAGLNTTANSWIGLETDFDATDAGELNESRVNCILSQRNHGICIWGARVAKANKEQNRYFVNQTNIDIYMDRSLHELTLWTVFENLSDQLMVDTIAQVKEFMTGMYNAGAIVGAKAEDSYNIVCDWTNNSMDADEFIVDVQYAKTKPNEFTVIRIRQKKASM